MPGPDLTGQRRIGVLVQEHGQAGGGLEPFDDRHLVPAGQPGRCADHACGDVERGGGGHADAQHHPAGRRRHPLLLAVGGVPGQEVRQRVDRGGVVQGEQPLDLGDDAVQIRGGVLGGGGEGGRVHGLALQVAQHDGEVRGVHVQADRPAGLGDDAQDGGGLAGAGDALAGGLDQSVAQQAARDQGDGLAGQAAAAHHLGLGDPLRRGADHLQHEPLVVGADVGHRRSAHAAPFRELVPRRAGTGRSPSLPRTIRGGDRGRAGIRRPCPVDYVNQCE